MDKRYEDGVETENSFPESLYLGMPEEATSGPAKVLPVERKPIPI